MRHFNYDHHEVSGKARYIIRKSLCTTAFLLTIVPDMSEDALPLAVVERQQRESRKHFRDFALNLIESSCFDLIWFGHLFPFKKARNCVEWMIKHLNGHAEFHWIIQWIIQCKFRSYYRPVTLTHLSVLHDRQGGPSSYFLQSTLKIG